MYNYYYGKINEFPIIFFMNFIRMIFNRTLVIYQHYNDTYTRSLKLHYGIKNKTFERFIEESNVNYTSQQLINLNL